MKNILRKFGATMLLVGLFLTLTGGSALAGGDHDYDQPGVCQEFQKQIKYAKFVKKHGDWKLFAGPSDWIVYPKDGMVDGLVAGGKYKLGEKFQIHRTWYKYDVVKHQKVIVDIEGCGTTTTTTTAEETTTTTAEETTTTTAPSTTTSSVSVTTATVPVLRDLQPYTFCADGSTWIGVEFVGFSSVYYWIEDPLGTADGQIFNSEAVKFGVLRTDTFFTFWGDGDSAFSATLNVPATDCSEESTTTSTDPSTPTTDPGTLPMTGPGGLDERAGAGLALLGLGGLVLLLSRKTEEDI